VGQLYLFPLLLMNKEQMQWNSVIIVRDVHDMLGAARDGYGLHWA